MPRLMHHAARWRETWNSAGRCRWHCGIVACISWALRVWFAGPSIRRASPRFCTWPDRCLKCARSHAVFAGTVLNFLCVLLVFSIVLVIPALILPLITLISRLSG